MTLFKRFAMGRLVWQTAGLWSIVLCMSASGQGQNWSWNPYSAQPGYDSILNNTVRRPTVSPYLNLLLPGALPGTSYQTLVRPALEQQRINRDQEMQMNRLQQQFSSALQSSTSRPQREQGIRPTGHQAAFFYYSRFYFNQPRAGR